MPSRLPTTPWILFARPSRSVVLGALAVLLVGCGGGGEPPIAPPPVITISRLTFSNAPTSVEAGDTVALAVTLTRTTGAQVVTIANPAGVVIQSSDVSVGQLLPGTPSRLATVAAGQVTVTATIEGLEATAAVAVTRAVARTVQFTADVLVVPAGVSTVLPVVLTGRGGQPITGPYLLETVSTVGGSVQIAGTAITLGAGATATVRVTADGQTDTIELRAASQAPAGATALALGQPFVRIGVPVTITAPSSDAASLRVGGQPATRTTVTATSATFTLPTAPFGTCLEGGAVLPVEVTTPSGVWAFTLPALNPVRMTVALNDVQYPFDAVLAGCLIAVDAGTYDVQFYRWDLGYDTVSYGKGGVGYAKSAAEPVALTVRSATRAGSLASAPVALGAPMAMFAAANSRAVTSSPEIAASKKGTRHVFMPTTLEVAQHRASARLAGTSDVQQPGWRTTSGGSCAIPTTVGDSVVLYTQRVNGQITRYPGQSGRNVEPWLLVGVSPRIAVFVDTTYRRTSLASNQALINKVVAAYDSTVDNWYRQIGQPVPDQDGTGRLVMLLPDVPVGGDQSSAAFPTTYGRPDCPLGTFDPTTGLPRSGGAEMVLMRAPLTAQAFGGFMHTLVHEVGHVVDVISPGVNQTARARNMWWSTEGVAEILTWVWAQSARPDPFNGRVASLDGRRLEGVPVIKACALPARAQLQTWFTFTFQGYPLACQLHAWAMQSVTAAGASPAEALRRIVKAPERSTMASVLAALRGTSAVEFPFAIGDFYAAFSEPSPGPVPRRDVVFGPQNLALTTTPPFSSPFAPVVLAPGTVFRDQIGEVDLQVVRVSATDELLLDVRAERAAIGNRMGVGVRRR